MFILKIYNLLWYVVNPFIKRHLRYKAKSYPDYAKYHDERFASNLVGDVSKKKIWLHAVSIGETKAAYPIIIALLKEYTPNDILLTQMTPTARNIAKNLFPPDVKISYLPYDNPRYVRKFLDYYEPEIVFFLEKEIWPNYILECKKRNIKLYLVNATISNKTFKKYLFFKTLSYKIFSSFNYIFTQSKKDELKFKQLGIDNVVTVGNTKYDVPIEDIQYKLAKVLKSRIGSRKVIVCGSTRVYDNKNENNLILNAWKKNIIEDVLLIMVPRHPDYFISTYEYAKKIGLTVQLNSNKEQINKDTKVLIGDSLGELYSYYLVADIVFVGGSLVDAGCHNIIEPLSCNKPTTFGYSTYNQAICDEALEAKCVIKVKSADELFSKCSDILTNEELYKKLQNNIHVFLNKYRGASLKISHKIIDE